MQQQEGDCKVPQVTVRGQGQELDPLPQDVQVSPPLRDVLQRSIWKERGERSAGIRVLVLPSGAVGGGQPCSDLPPRGREEEPARCGFCKEPHSITHLQDQHFPPGLGTERSLQLGWRLQGTSLYK